MTIQKCSWSLSDKLIFEFDFVKKDKNPEWNRKVILSVILISERTLASDKYAYIT